MGNTIPFPQANDLERVMTILDIEDPDSLNQLPAGQSPGGS